MAAYYPPPPGTGPGELRHIVMRDAGELNTFYLHSWAARYGTMVKEDKQKTRQVIAEFKRMEDSPNYICIDVDAYIAGTTIIDIPSTFACQAFMQKFPFNKVKKLSGDAPLKLMTRLPGGEHGRVNNLFFEKTLRFVETLEVSILSDPRQLRYLVHREDIVDEKGIRSIRETCCIHTLKVYEYGEFRINQFNDVYISNIPPSAMVRIENMEFIIPDEVDANVEAGIDGINNVMMAFPHLKKLEISTPCWNIDVTELRLVLNELMVLKLRFIAADGNELRGILRAFPSTVFLPNLRSFHYHFGGIQDYLGAHVRPIIASLKRIIRTFPKLSFIKDAEPYEEADDESDSDEEDATIDDNQDELIRTHGNIDLQVQDILRRFLTEIWDERGLRYFQEALQPVFKPPELPSVIAGSRKSGESGLIDGYLFRTREHGLRE